MLYATFQRIQKSLVWSETFITKIILAYGTVFSVNIVVLLLPIISKMHVDGVGGFGKTYGEKTKSTSAR